MQKQNVDIWRDEITQQFIAEKKKNPHKFEKRLNLSWSNWGFGLEDLEVSAARLSRAGLEFIELHGNHYGKDLGYKVEETKEVLQRYSLSVSGVCGMFSNENDLSSNIPVCQQRAIDYIRREVEFCSAMGGDYLLVVPGSVGRFDAYDEYEFERSVRTLRLVADSFTEYNVKAVIEPIRSAEVSLVHTVEEAIRYIKAVNHPGVQHINGDVYHMQVEESNIPKAILQADERLINLHLADSNRGTLGSGSMDYDTIIMALYLIGFNKEGHYVTPEPLGPGAGPYPARNGIQDVKVLDKLVNSTVSYFRTREEAVLSL